MSNQVAYECGYLDAMRLLREGRYISPFATLEHTRYIITDGELQSYYEGCRDAVIHHTNHETHTNHQA
jgi:hypothetical protein